jgi:hypothetical protein
VHPVEDEPVAWADVVDHAEVDQFEPDRVVLVDRIDFASVVFWEGLGLADSLQVRHDVGDCVEHQSDFDAGEACSDAVAGAVAAEG